MHGGLSQFKALVARRNERISRSRGKFDPNFKDKKGRSVLKSDFNQPLYRFDLHLITSEISRQEKTNKRKKILALVISLLIVAALVYWINP